jgi:hypothetical protein
VAISWWILLVVGGAALGVFLALVIPPVSRRRNRRRASAQGAYWAGLANFEASAPGSDPTVVRAFVDVGQIYGAAFARRPPYGMRKPVGGLLLVGPDGLRWEPRIWLGRGKAHAWSLEANAVRGVEIEKMPLPAVNSFRVRLVTVDGDAAFLVVDPQGLQDAVAKLGNGDPRASDAV